jgi:hypothetical protein
VLPQRVDWNSSAIATPEVRQAWHSRSSVRPFTATTRNVAAFDLWLGVGSVDFAAPVTVTVNGSEVLRKVVAPDVAFLLERALEDDDRTMLYGAGLSIDVPPPAK